MLNLLVIFFYLFGSAVVFYDFCVERRNSNSNMRNRLGLILEILLIVFSTITLILFLTQPLQPVWLTTVLGLPLVFMIHHLTSPKENHTLLSDIVQTGIIVAIVVGAIVGGFIIQF